MLLDSACQIPDKKKRLFDELNSSRGRGMFVLGRNKCAAHLGGLFDVAGFIDDYTDESIFMGKPVLRMNAVPRSSMVVSSCAGNALAALDRLQQEGFTRVLDYFALIGLAPNTFPDFYFGEVNRNNRQDMDANRQKYEWLYSRFADDASRRVFEKIMRFRYFMNLECLRGFKNDIEGQYFDECVVWGPEEVFVDGGGYDGDTSLRFAQRCANYKAIYYFEPAAHLMASSREKLKDLNRVHFIQKGLYSENGILNFDVSRDICSRLSNEGGAKIEVVRLDDEVKEKITYIKLDLEGAEFNTLCGARAHLQADRPKLAIGAYHDQPDFWRIPEEVFRNHDAYDLYFRHYTEMVYDSVYYFIPR